MQRLNGIGRAFTQCVQFLKCAIAALENHASSAIAFAALVSAFATSAIFFLTISYVHYSKAQWQTMQSTLKYQIRQTQARLAITNLSVSNFPQAPVASFCVENDGHAMADEIDIDVLRSMGPFDGVSPFGPASGPISFHASQSGTSLGEGKMNCNYRSPIREYPGGASFLDIAAGKPHTGLWIQVAAAYRDTVTEQSYVATSCVCWLGSPWNYFSSCISPTSPTKEQHSSVAR